MFRISLQPIEVSYAFARLTSVLLRVHNVNEELETNETDFVSSSCHDMTGRGLCKCFLFSSLGFMVRFEKLPHLLCNTSHFDIEICNKSSVEFIQNWKSSYCCNILRFLAETVVLSILNGSHHHQSTNDRKTEESQQKRTEQLMNLVPRAVDDSD